MRHWDDWVPPDANTKGPRLVLAFGASIKPLRLLECDDVHHAPIRRGSRICCAVCHRSGLDHLDLPGRIDRGTEGRSEGQIKAAAKAQRLHKASR